MLTRLPAPPTLMKDDAMMQLWTIGWLKVLRPYLASLGAAFGAGRAYAPVAARVRPRRR